MQKLIADIQLGPQLTGPSSALSNVGSEADATALFTATLSKIIGVITVVAFIWFTIQMMIGAIGILSSGGDKGAVEKARKQITTGILGVVIVIAGIFIVDFIGTLLGLKNILNPVCVVYGNC